MAKETKNPQKEKKDGGKSLKKTKSNCKRAKKNEKKSVQPTLVCQEPSTAGIDVAKDLIQVCVPSDRDEDPNREFQSFTEDLHAIAKWLKKCGIKRCIMESTGHYWFHLFYILDQYGFETILVNPREVKNYTARKSDVDDAEWLMFIGSHGLYKNSFQTSWWVSDLKSLSRHREILIKDAARELQHMQKAMELMNIKLSSVISDISGLSGMNIIKAILAGERDPHTLADLANYRCSSTKEEIAKALEGTWDRAYLLELRHALKCYEFKRAQVAECEKEMESIMEENVPEYKNETLPYESMEKQKVKSSVHFDIERMAYNAWHVNVMTIPGISDGAAIRLLSELGPDFLSKFPTAKKFCRWCNVAPKDGISGGKVLYCRTEKRKSAVGQVFRQAASTLTRSKTSLGLLYRKTKSRVGPVKANVFVAHKIATIFYNMIKTGQNYVESLTAEVEERMLTKRIQRLEKERLRLQVKLETLGAVI